MWNKTSGNELAKKCGNIWRQSHHSISEVVIQLISIFRQLNNLGKIKMQSYITDGQLNHFR